MNLSESETAAAKRGFRSRWIALVGVCAMALTLAVSVGPHADEDRAVAADRADFDPAYLISDENFYAGGAMTESQVQSFLDARVPSCVSGYTCLKDYAQSTTSRVADSQCSAYSGASNETAARIITKVARACNISPRVLIVMLEKEQSLVTSSSPSGGRYNIAMGYACPDTAACDTRYYGFYNQVYMAAWQLKRYGDPTSSFTWFPVGSPSSVRYHPNVACGSSQLTIRNKATAALYYYTPYQPNAAALNNLYGTGDACSAYGNRNFWRLYSDWFGDPKGSRIGSLDSATGVYKGIRVTGWAIDPNSTASTYIWINVDGTGGPALADKPLGWFNGAFPGYGPNHGFDVTVPASLGQHEVCVYRGSTPLGCRNVEVPRAIGHVDSATGVVGGIRLTGWSVDVLATGPSYIWINVDGQGGPYRTNVTLPWLSTMFPGASPEQGYSIVVPSKSGTHEVCVYGAGSTLTSCRNVTVPRAAGHLDSAVGVNGGVVISGWSVDADRPDGSYIWVTVDGRGGPYKTNTEKSWIPNYFPGTLIGPNNGFEVKVPATKGSHRICVYGAVSLLGCRDVTVALSTAGHVDVIEPVDGGIRVAGWSVDFKIAPSSSYVWVNVNGSGGPFRANLPLTWFERLYPGTGPNHGFDATIPKAPGSYEVCVYGSESTLLRCQVVSVQ